MSFWDKAFNELGDNLDLLKSVVSDGVGNINPWDDRFLSGDAPATAATAEEQNAARQGRDVSQARIDASAKGGIDTILEGGKQTAADVGREVKDVATKAGSALDFFLSPVGVGVAVGVVVLVLTAPYLAPVAVKALS